MSDTRDRARTQRIARKQRGVTVTTLFVTILSSISTVAGANALPEDVPLGTAPAKAAGQGSSARTTPESSPQPPDPATTPASAANLTAPAMDVPATTNEPDLSPPASGTLRLRTSDTPIFEKWWFWTAITAVAVTAVVIVATSSGPSAPHTDLGNMVAF
jgi:hypothetical protein